MSTAVRDASISLKNMVQTALNADPDVQALLPPGGTLNVSLNTPEEMAQANEQGVSFWLYRIVRDENLLNRPPRRIAPDRLRLQPLPLRLHYLVSAVLQRMEGVPAPEFEQVVLGKVLQLFHERPQLRGSALTGILAGRDLEISVRLESLSLDEMSRVWDALERSYQVSLSYEISVVPIDARRDITTGPPVMIFEPEIGIAEPA